MVVNQNARVLMVVLSVLFCLPGVALMADEVNLPASKDNTIYSEGALSNAVGDYLFGGETGIGDFRRSLIKFDIAAGLPAGVTIDEVQLSLNVSKVPDLDSHNFSLYRLTSDWGEGSSNAPGVEGGGTDASTDDATWSHTFFPFNFWTTAGGDYLETASVTALIGGLGTAIWPSTDALVADVQQWLDQPDSNFGWILIGNETAGGTAKRFNSRENPAVNLRPKLTIMFTSPPTGACCSMSGECTDVQASVCQASGGFFNSEGSSCALIQECPFFQDGFEN